MQSLLNEYTDLTKPDSYLKENYNTNFDSDDESNYGNFDSTPSIIESVTRIKRDQINELSKSKNDELFGVEDYFISQRIFRNFAKVLNSLPDIILLNYVYTYVTRNSTCMMEFENKEIEFFIEIGASQVSIFKKGKESKNYITYSIEEINNEIINSLLG